MEKIAVIGMGYVGLPLALELSKKYEVTGYDIDEIKIDEIDKSVSHFNTKIHFTLNAEDLSESTVYIVTVPTPINFDKTPDLEPLITATRMIGNQLKPHDLVIYESTVYPGTTEEVCVPILEEISGMMINEHFSVGYSPERINPGDEEWTLTKIKKVVSASNPSALSRVKEIYNSIIEAGLHTASSIKVAEASKVIENAQRDLNIAFMNELSKVFGLMNINTDEVLEAARTKWNFLDFKPGLVGGHCIGIDPYYFIYKAEQLGYRSQIISAARKTNETMVNHVVNEIVRLAITNKVDTRSVRVVVFGVSFKRNSNDLRNSKVIEMIELLKQMDWKVEAYDPLISNTYDKRVPLMKQLQKETVDIVIMAVPHDIILSQYGLNEIIELYRENSPRVFINLQNAYVHKFRNRNDFVYWGM